MTRRLRILILIALSAFAATGVIAPTAQALFKTTSEIVTVTATPDGTGKTAHHVIDLAGASVTCSKMSGEGTVFGPETERFEISPSYSECNFVGQTATVNTNGCSYEYNFSGAVEINCPSGKEMTVSVPSPVCDVVIPPQGGLFNATYTNTGFGGFSEITVSMGLSGVDYTATGAGCPETGKFFNGTYTTGNTIITGETISKGMVPFFYQFP